MTRIFPIVCLATFVSVLCIGPQPVSAQVYVAPAQPAVVGYSAERRGLFGRRVVMRPVVAPVAVAPVAVAPVAVAPVAVARPVVAAPVTVARPVVAAPVAVARPVVPVTVARPIVAAPTRAYYAPTVPVATPVIRYRVPVRTIVPVVAY